MDTTRKCSVCLQEKTLDNFYFLRNKGLYSRRCRLCEAEYQHRYYKSHKEEKYKRYLSRMSIKEERGKVLERKRKYYLLRREKILNRMQLYYRAHRLEKIKSLLLSRLLYPEKLRARRMVHAALRAGLLIRERCIVCGDPKSHAHHPDYSHPLEVVWLCPKHHGEEHRVKL